MLSEVDHLWGSAALIERDPGEEFHMGAIFVPFKSNVYFEHDPDWGVYDRHGALVQAAAHTRGPDQAIVGQSATTTLLPRDLDVIEEELIYCGPVMLHYGHFLTTTLPRFWHINASSGRRFRLLCHAHEEPTSWFKRPFVMQIFGALGLTPDDFIWLDGPRVLRRLWIPRPAMIEQQSIHRALERLATVIGRTYGVHLENRGGRPVYLSKTKLSSGITRFDQEEELERRLESRGFEIVYPEDLSFDEQLRIFARARTLTGTLGSGFHTSMFLGGSSRIVALAPVNTLNTNYVLIDRLMRNETLYLYPTTPSSARASDATFQTVWTVKDIVAVAEDYATRALSTQPLQPHFVLGCSNGSRPSQGNAMIKRSEVVQGLLSLFKDPSYLEIGVAGGETFFNVTAAKKVAVDPQFQFDVAEAAVKHIDDSQFFAISSDDYFGSIVEPHQRFHVIYLDGLHTLEQTLRDFTNALEYLHDDGVILVDDILPRSYFGSLKTMTLAFKVRDHLGETDGAWMGDTYRLAYFIDSFFQQYSMRTVADNEGQLVVWKSRRPKVTARLVEQVGRLPFEEVILDETTLRKSPFSSILSEIQAERRLVVH